MLRATCDVVNTKQNRSKDWEWGSGQAKKWQAPARKIEGNGRLKAADRAHGGFGLMEAGSEGPGRRAEQGQMKKEISRTHTSHHVMHTWVNT